jgi:hypothetical protein
MYNAKNIINTCILFSYIHTYNVILSLSMRLLWRYCNKYTMKGYRVNVHDAKSPIYNE